jgi:predicted transcriptional regulator
MSSKRVTIMLEDDLVKKIHDIQARQIKETSGSISFSAVLNQVIRKNFKK